MIRFRKACTIETPATPEKRYRDDVTSVPDHACAVSTACVLTAETSSFVRRLNSGSNNACALHSRFPLPLRVSVYRFSFFRTPPLSILPILYSDARRTRILDFVTVSFSSTASFFARLCENRRRTAQALADLLIPRNFIQDNFVQFYCFFCTCRRNEWIRRSNKLLLYFWKAYF